MNGVTIRVVCNRNAEVLRRVERGESLTVTRQGEPVATVAPLPRRTVQIAELIARRRLLPLAHADELITDIDELIDPEL